MVETLVTGAGGFVGAALVAALRRRGADAGRLRCLVRDRRRAVAAGIPEAAVCVGDLLDLASLRAAAAGVDVVVHLAGAIKAARRDEFTSTNWGGTVNLVAALSEVAPRAHLIAVSSLAAAGPSVDGQGTDQLPQDCRPVSHYGRSKRAGELAVIGSPLAWTIVRPPVVYGPGDAATALLFRQACGLICPVPPAPRPLSVIHVDDVVRALLALHGLPAQRRVVPLDGPERTDTHAFLQAIAAACGRRARLLSVPLFVAAGAATVADVWAWCTRRAAFFSRDKVRELRTVGWVADGSAARQLGIVPEVALAEGLRGVAAALGLRPGPA